MFHPWVKAPKGKGKRSAIDKLFYECYPHAKRDEIEVLKFINDAESLRKMAREHGWTDKEIKELSKK